MFLTRSKTSSALNTYEQQQQQQQLKKQQQQHTADFPPLIPKEMISVLQDAMPSIESALKPVLPSAANELIVDMLSTWITCSRIAAANNDFNNNSMPNKPSTAATAIKPMTLRSWASRSFSVNRSKSTVAVAQLQQPLKIEISDPNNNKLCSNNYTTPSLSSVSASSSRSSLSISEEEDDNELYTPLLLDSAAPPTSVTIPVSLKSMIDLLDTPPLIPDDAKSLSLIEETLTPLSSTFFHDDNESGKNLAVENKTTERIESSPMAATFTTVNSVTSTTKGTAEIKSIRRSISTIFVQLSNSMKKVFATNKKKSRSTDISVLKKTLSVQHNLSSVAEQQPKETPIKQQTSPMSVKLSYSSLASNNESDVVQDDMDKYKPLPYERPEVKAYAAAFAAFATFMSTGEIDKSLANIYGGSNRDLRKSAASSTTSLMSNLSLYSETQDDLIINHIQPNLELKRQPTSYWDGDDATQSQQFEQLLDDIWERSQEYQDYFAAEERSNSIISTNINSSTKKVKTSRTEGNMNSFEDSVPFVCVGNSIAENSKRNSRQPQQVHQKLLNIEDVKAYKRSTSAYSNIRDYDLNWQKSFHIEQESRDKVAKTLKSVSWAFYSIIKKNHNLNEFACDAIFDENESTISEGSTFNYCAEPLTDWSDIYDQLAYVFDCGELTAEHAVITFIYVKRMLDLSKQKLWDFSWRMIIMSSLLTAVKVWDDCAIFNADFAMIFPELTLEMINNIERVFLTHLEWDVSVSCSEFAKTYFYLRDIEHMMEQW